eukprot:jgi/Mesvir1/27412/Mv07210-RA.1
MEPVERGSGEWDLADEVASPSTSWAVISEGGGQSDNEGDEGAFPARRFTSGRQGLSDPQARRTDSPNPRDKARKDGSPDPRASRKHSLDPHSLDLQAQTSDAPDEQARKKHSGLLDSAAAARKASANVSRGIGLASVIAHVPLGAAPGVARLFVEERPGGGEEGASPHVGINLEYYREVREDVASSGDEGVVNSSGEEGAGGQTSGGDKAGHSSGEDGEEAEGGEGFGVAESEGTGLDEGEAGWIRARGGLEGGWGKEGGDEGESAELAARGSLRDVLAQGGIGLGNYPSPFSDKDTLRGFQVLDVLRAEAGFRPSFTFFGNLYERPREHARTAQGSGQGAYDWPEDDLVETGIKIGIRYEPPSPKFSRHCPRRISYRLDLSKEGEFLFSTRGMARRLAYCMETCTAQWGDLLLSFPSAPALRKFLAALRHVDVSACHAHAKGCILQVPRVDTGDGGAGILAATTGEEGALSSRPAAAAETSQGTEGTEGPGLVPALGKETYLPAAPAPAVAGEAAVIRPGVVNVASSQGMEVGAGGVAATHAGVAMGMSDTRGVESAHGASGKSGGPGASGGANEGPSAGGGGGGGGDGERHSGCFPRGGDVGGHAQGSMAANSQEGGGGGDGGDDGGDDGGKGDVSNVGPHAGMSGHVLATLVDVALGGDEAGASTHEGSMPRPLSVPSEGKAQGVEALEGGMGAAEGEGAMGVMGGAGYGEVYAGGESSMWEVLGQEEGDEAWSAALQAMRDGEGAVARDACMVAEDGGVEGATWRRGGDSAAFGAGRVTGGCNGRGEEGAEGEWEVGGEPRGHGRSSVGGDSAVVLSTLSSLSSLSSSSSFSTSSAISDDELVEGEGLEGQGEEEEGRQVLPEEVGEEEKEEAEREGKFREGGSGGGRDREQKAPGGLQNGKLAGLLASLAAWLEHGLDRGLAWLECAGQKWLLYVKKHQKSVAVVVFTLTAVGVGATAMGAARSARWRGAPLSWAERTA